MVFDRNDLWFVELKMNTISVLDNQLWNDVNEAMDQLNDFVHDLRCKMSNKRTPLHRYYSLNRQHCTVCMKSYPRMNTERNNQLEHFRLETGIKLQLRALIP